MADTKISGLTAATSILATDELPVARSGTTRKVTGAMLVPSIVTSLPGSPVDTDEIYLKVGSGDTAVLWHLKYDSSITDAYKWRFVGGSPLHSTRLTSENRNSGTYATISSLPAVTLPGIGVYEFSHGFDSTASGAASWGIQNVQTNGSAPGDDNECCQSKPVGNDSVVTVMRTFQRTVASVSTSAVAVCVYRTGFSTNFFNRWLSALPVRLG